MKCKRILRRVCVLGLTVLVAVSALFASASATTLEEAKASLAEVEITQTVNGVTTPVTGTTTGHTKDKTVRDLHVSEQDVSSVKNIHVVYAANLQMTDLMAEYLQPRQKNLMVADFNVHLHLDLDKLDFSGADPLRATISSTFLKPKAGGPFSFRLKSANNGRFSYELTAPKADVLATGGDLVFPMELIVAVHGGVPLSYGEAKAYPAEHLLYENFKVSDWMQLIKLELGELDVKESVRTAVKPGSNEVIRAYGSVDGEFAYISDPADSVKTLMNYDQLGFVTELEFGNDSEITEWVSNETEVHLVNRSKDEGGGGNPGGNGDRPEGLNTADHYSYIIGYNDGTIRPTGSITRGEVATIFFRLLDDETRDQYWCQTNKYSDVPASLWCNNAISTMSNMGIINGYRDGTFRPQGKITRAEFAKIAVGFFSTAAEPYRGVFKDVYQGDWFSSYVEIANRVGLIGGYRDGTFRPQNNITRAESCAIVNRTLGRHPHKSHLLPEQEMITWPDNHPSDWFYADMQEATNSHDYRWITEGREEWTAKLPQRNWSALEKEWSSAHSSSGGEVMP